MLPDGWFLGVGVSSGDALLISCDLSPRWGLGVLWVGCFPGACSYIPPAVGECGSGTIRLAGVALTVVCGPDLEQCWSLSPRTSGQCASTGADRWIEGPTYRFSFLVITAVLTPASSTK